MSLLVIGIIAVALLFDFLNGMNDAANSIATVVSTRVLSPAQAVAWAAFFNFVAAFGFGVSVAATIGKGIVDPAVVTPGFIASALFGAILWTAVCTRWGLPISVSHALIGGLVGAGLAKAGPGCLLAKGLGKTVLFIFLSPIIGFLLGTGVMVAVFWLFRRAAPHRVDRFFRIGQLVSSAWYSLSHGSNDAQKTMGIIAILLFSTGHLGPTFYVPIWVILSCHAMIALGTLAGGWQVIKTLGTGVTKLRPVGGFCAESAAGLSILLASFAGIPVSTTHTITGAILGVGSTVRLSAVRWGVAGRIMWAWVLTIPGSALLSGAAYAVVAAVR